MPAPGRSPRRRGRQVASLVALAVALAAPPALAGDPPKKEDGLPVIAGGREAEIQALFTPFKLGAEPGPGWFLDTIGIDATAIQVKVVSKTKSEATLRFGLAKRTPSPEKTPSFSVVRGGDTAGAQAALDALVEAVRKNDKGAFWPEAAPVPGPDGEEMKPEGFALLPGGEEAARKAGLGQANGKGDDGSKAGPQQGGGGAAAGGTASQSRRRLLLAGALVIAVAILLLGRGGKRPEPPPAAPKA